MMEHLPSTLIETERHTPSVQQCQPSKTGGRGTAIRHTASRPGRGNVVQKYSGGKITCQHRTDGSVVFKQDFQRETHPPAEWVAAHVRNKFAYRDSWGAYCWEKGWKRSWLLSTFPDGGDGSGPKGYALLQHCKQLVWGVYGLAPQELPDDVEYVIVMDRQAEAMMRLVLKLQTAATVS